MECPTALKILKELNKSEKAGTVFNSFGNPDKKREVKIALEELKQAINSHEKLVEKLQEIISRLGRNRNAERLNSEATKKPSKSFWRGQAEKASEVMIWLEQALKKAEGK